MTQKAIVFNHTTARRFTMRLVQKGDQYGLRMGLTHDKAEAMVEFYDLTYNFDKDENGEVLGQFTGGRYYVSTFLRAGGSSRGICFDGGTPVWSLDGLGLVDAQCILREWLGA